MGEGLELEKQWNILAAFELEAGIEVLLNKKGLWYRRGLRDRNSGRKGSLCREGPRKLVIFLL